MALSSLPLLFFLVVAASTALRLAWLHHRGVHAFAVRWSDDAHGFLNRAFIGLFVALFVFCAAFAARPDLVDMFGPVHWLVTPFVAWPGALIAACGAVLTILAQFEMGRSWRLGVREGDRSDLVIDGLYSFSRNPIYVGLMITLGGIFLIAPNAVTFALVVAGWITVSAQIRLEEDYLAGAHGADYAAYKARTSRWLPRSVRGLSLSSLAPNRKPGSGPSSA